MSRERDAPLANPSLCSLILMEANNKLSSVVKVGRFKYHEILVYQVRIRVLHCKITCQCGAVRGNPFRTHSRLCKCHWAAAMRAIPNGVQRSTTPCHESHPPAANNHQSKTDKIVQPAPAPQRHLRLILCNLPLTFALWLFVWLLDAPCWSCDFEKGRFTMVHLGVHCFGRKFVAFEILNANRD